MLEVGLKQEKVNQGAAALLAQKEVKFAMNELLSWQISLPSAPALSKKNDFKEAFQIESFN